MNLYLSIALTSLAIIAGMYLLAKTKAESLGKFFRFTSWLVIVVSGLSLLCQVGCGMCRMACYSGVCPPSENCMPRMMEEHGCMDRMKGSCSMHEGCQGMEEGCGRKSCDGMSESHGKCCDEMHESGCDHDMKKDHEMEERKDSLKTNGRN
jgi:hypothetical protein